MKILVTGATGSQGSYLLPLKAEVRKKEKMSAGDSVNFSLEIKA